MKSLPVLAASTRRGASLFEPLKGAERLAGGEARNERNHRIAWKHIYALRQEREKRAAARPSFTIGIFRHIQPGRAPASPHTLLGTSACDDALPD